MRKSNRSTGARLAAAGLTVGTVTAAVLAGPLAAQATAVTSITPSSGPTGATISVLATGGFTSATSLGAIFTTATTCPATYSTSTATAASSTTKVDADHVNIGVPTGLALGTNGVPKTYAVCVYAGTAATSALLTDSASPKTYTLVPSATAAPASGTSGGGGTLTLTAASGTTPFSTTAPAVLFGINAACPDTYGTPTARIGTGVTKNANGSLSVNVPADVVGTGPTTSYGVCVYGSTTSSDTLTAQAAYSVSLPTATLSSTVGALTGGNGLTATSATPFLLGVSTLGTEFTNQTTCPANYATPSSGSPYSVLAAAAGGTRRVSDSKLAVTVPNVTNLGSSPSTLLACFYNGSTVGTSTLVATAPYTAATPPTLTGVTPASGSSFGGTNIVVTGTGFPTTPGSITATLGGAPLMNITPVNANTFTATTPMHAAANGVAVVVTTPYGTRSLGNVFTFINSIEGAPNTAPNTITSVDISVKGVGFLSTNFDSSTTLTTGSHVYLVNGTYNPYDDGSGNKSLGPTTECLNVLPISDNELICTLRLNRMLNAAGVSFPTTYTSNATAADVITGSRTITATTGKFSQADVGQPIAGADTTKIAAGTLIAQVLSPTKAILDRDPVAGAAAYAVTIGNAAARTTGATAVHTVNNSTTLSGSANTFQQADVGRLITGTGIPTGTTVLAVNSDGTQATISAAATATSSPDVQGSLYAPEPVPAGAYTLTLVSNGAVGAPLSDPDYNQSAVAPGSTFTVTAQ